MKHTGITLQALPLLLLCNSQRKSGEEVPSPPASPSREDRPVPPISTPKRPSPPTQGGDELTRTRSFSSPAQPTPEGPPNTGPKEEEWTVAPPESGGWKANKPGPSIPQVTEKPLDLPRLYRETTPTMLWDKPTWTGQEVTQLKPETKIFVIATAGDWLKVESKANPPKPPGYVWKEDAQPE